MIYIIYKTTNLVNGKIYIGCHATKNINDGYLGSGNLITAAIKKYGKNSFSREILYVFDNYKEMVDKETEIVNKEFIKCESNYNISVGGAFDYRDNRKKPTVSLKLKNRVFSIDTIEKMKGKVPIIDNITGNRFKVSCDEYKRLKEAGSVNHTSLGFKHTTESKNKISEKGLGRKRSEAVKQHLSKILSGSGNHFFGKHHSEETKEILSIKRGHAIFIDGIKYNSINAASKQLGLNRSTIYRKLYSDEFENFYYATKSVA